MLKELRAVGFGIIDDLSLEFDAGLNVLSGETGAGKSMIVGALSSVLGGKLDSGVLRSGVDEGRVEARFTTTPEVVALLEGAGFDLDDDVVLARRLKANGSRAYVNGQMATIAQLEEIGAELIEIVGQGSARLLRVPRAQLDALDRYCGEEIVADLAKASSAFAEIRALESEIESISGDPVERAREADLVRYQLEEIASACVDEGEADELASEITRLTNAEALCATAAGAHDGIDSARDILATHAQELALATDAELKALGTSLDAVVTELDETAATTRTYAESIKADPSRLSECQSRLSLVRSIYRRYGPTFEDVVAFCRAAQSRLDDLDASDERCRKFADRLERATGEFEEVSESLSATRMAGARLLSDAVTQELCSLELSGATFDVVIDRLQKPSRLGRDGVEFVFSGGPGQALAPIRTVASGGEVARLMLAVSKVTAGLEAVPTMVFDEIDSGTGGRAATAVGVSMAELSQTRQLICVTHLAQVACRAGTHIAISKDSSGAAHAVRLDRDERVGELARMLSGASTSTARSHAAELLDVAQPIGAP